MLTIDEKFSPPADSADYEAFDNDVFATGLANQITGACMVLNHLGLKRNDHGWMDGYDEFAVALVAIHMDAQYEQEEEPVRKWVTGGLNPDSPERERNGVKMYAQLAAFNALFAQYQIPKGSLLYDTIIRIMGH